MKNEKTSIIKIEYGEDIFGIISIINEALKHTGYEFEFIEEDVCDGYETLYLVKKD